MDLGIAGKVALITAASKGLGLASASALAAEGASVVITGRDPSTLDPAGDQLRRAGGRKVLTVAGDITDPDEPARVVSQTVSRFGRLDIVVANAGGPPSGQALEVSDDMVMAAVNANLLATVRVVRAALPHLQAEGAGRICCITSSSVVEPIPTLTLSNLARLGLWGWAKTAAADLAESGVTLNLICPGLHGTDRITQLGFTGRMGNPTDFGQTVAFLCSEQANFITGTTLVVDGGASKGV